MADTDNVGKDILHILASLVTLFAFITGLSSLPSVFGVSSGNTTLSFGVLPQFDIQVRVALLLVGLPIFNIADTWLAISLGRVFIAFFEHFNIEGESAYWALLLAVLLPLIVGMNLFFLSVLFGSVVSFSPIVLGVISVVTTAIFVWNWADSL